MTIIVKKIIYFSVFFVVLGFSLIHIYTQIRILNVAVERNNAYSIEISNIVAENKIMRQKIEYATSSSFQEKRIKGELSFGNDNDYKIIVDNNLKDMDLYPKTDKKDTKTIQEWFKLFTQ